MDSLYLDSARNQEKSSTYRERLDREKNSVHKGTETIVRDKEIERVHCELKLAYIFLYFYISNLIVSVRVKDRLLGYDTLSVVKRIKLLNR